MGRKHKNAEERIIKKWDTKYINNLMRQLRTGNYEKEYDTPIIIPSGPEQRGKIKKGK